MYKRQMKPFKSKLILKSNEVRVELIFSADDNEHAPESPILLSCAMKNINEVITLL